MKFNRSERHLLVYILTGPDRRRDSMDKRTANRISINLFVTFPCRRTYVSGFATNLSENGMFINAEMSFPVKSQFELLIPLKEEAVKVPVKIVRLEKSRKGYQGMGVQIMGRPPKYLELIRKLNFS